MVMKYKKNPELIEKENDGRLLLFNVNTGAMVELNEIAALLWSNTEDSFDISALKKIVEERCHGFADLEKDMTDFLKTALEKNIIQDGKDKIPKT